MNILYTNFHYGPGGGHTTYILALVRNQRHRKYVACPPQSLLYRTLEEQGFDGLIPLDFPHRLHELPRIVKNSFALKKIIAEKEIDLVHTNGSADNLTAMYARWLSGKKFKVVLTKHNTHKIRGAISNARFKNFNDAVIFVTDFIFEAIGLPNDSPKYHVVENGIDPEYWKKTEEISTSADCLTLVSNAGTTLRKGWTYLAEALATLPQADRARLKVQVLGRLGEDLAEEMERAKRISGMEFPGFHDPRPFLEKGDVGFILSYAGEACSFACREMMSMALPVLVSDYSGHVKNVDDSCGWVTRARDVESIREALLKILSLSAEEISTMKAAARAKAEKYFSIDTMLEATNRVYDQLMQG
ncbi:glycosyltransferase family 4 protein [Desulfovibrio sp. OttesenSCG-928-C14]|nr:glycosyltransferase family 4 protein [Desulfovibrio sp. OttesenSCG-928-C14]